MGNRFIKENEIELAEMVGLKPREEMGPYLTNFLFHGKERREGKVELIKTDDGHVIYHAHGPLEGYEKVEEWHAWRGGTPERMYEILLSDEFQVAGGEKEARRSELLGIRSRLEKKLAANSDPLSLIVTGWLSGDIKFPLGI